MSRFPSPGSGLNPASSPPDKNPTSPRSTSFRSTANGRSAASLHPRTSRASPKTRSSSPPPNGGATHVPGNFQTQGHGKPHHTDVQMPWPHQPPPMPAANFTGVYRRRFTVTATWTGKRTVAPFGGATSVPAVYVNGIAVGLGKDSCPPPSSTSLEPCVSAKKTSSSPSSSRGPTPVSSGIETTGGSPAFSAKCFSTPHPKLNLPAFTPARRLPLNSPRPRSAFFARVGIIGVGPLPQGFTSKGAFLIAKIATFSKNRSSPRSTSPSNVSTTSPATCVLTCTPTAASWWTTTSCSPVPT